MNQPQFNKPSYYYSNLFDGCHLIGGTSSSTREHRKALTPIPIGTIHSVVGMEFRHCVIEDMSSDIIQYEFKVLINHTEIRNCNGSIRVLESDWTNPTSTTIVLILLHSHITHCTVNDQDMISSITPPSTNFFFNVGYTTFSFVSSPFLFLPLSSSDAFL